MKTNNCKGQQMIEYMLILSVVVIVLVVLLSRNGLLTKKIDTTFNKSFGCLEQMANCVCYKDDGLCAPVCGDNCCSPGEESSCPDDCKEGCGGGKNQPVGFSGGESGACVPVGCAIGSCGVISDGCGGTVDCGCCSLVCGPSDCGIKSDGCGGSIDCGACCVPQTCADLGVTCGSYPDGCGGTLDCGCCPIGCGPSDCGTISDGCGGTIDCGACCVPQTCADLGAVCGVQSDGCGGALDCGCCPATCGPTDCGMISDGCGGLINCGACVPSGIWTRTGGFCSGAACPSTTCFTLGVSIGQSCSNVGQQCANNCLACFLSPCPQCTEVLTCL